MTAVYVQEGAQIEAWGVLEIRAPGGREHELRLSGEAVTIGRDGENAVVLDDDHVSRRHARIERDGTGCRIVDLGSANGTRVATEELEPRVPHGLRDGDSVTIGPFALTLHLTPERIASAPETPAATDATIVAPTAGATVIAPNAERLVVSTQSGDTEITLGGGNVLTLGRSSDCDIVVDESVISRHHAEIRRGPDGWEISDAGSLNGLTFDGEKVQSRHLKDGDVISISETVKLTYSVSPAAGTAGTDGTTVQTLPLRDQAELSIGRDLTNEVQLDHPAVSRHHARIVRSGGGYTIEDLGSGNGTFTNGERLTTHQPHPLERGDVVRIGPVRFTLEMEGIQQVDESRNLRLDGVHLNQYVTKTLNLLQDISLSLEGGEFVALVGVSGAGKSTLLDALNGFRPARAGHVLVNGVDLYDNFDAYRTDLGYVPKDDIIHKELPVARALSYSAQLRLPPDTTKAEREERIEGVIAKLNLSERRDLPIVRLSGGQRKRVSIGAELLMQPGLFFLGEATSGLDPGTESQMMRLLRSLADQGHTIVLVTHATKNVMLCDQVAFLAKGGYLAWYGPPEEALEYFEVDDFDGIYERLDEELSPDVWGQKYADSPHYDRYVRQRLRKHYPNFSDTATEAADVAPAEREPQTHVQPAPRQTSQLRQFRILSTRYLDIIRRDRVNVALLLAIAPALGLIDIIAWPRNNFDPVGRLTPDEARTSEMRNIITRASGSSDSPEPDVNGPLTLSSGETLILTSDGLHGLVTQDEIAAVIAGNEPEEATQRLIQMARDAGAPDNISVVIYRAP